MSNYVPVSNASHANKRWVSSQLYDFARTTMAAPLTAEEMPRATRELACAFTKTNDRFALVALLGLQADTNLFVAPDGRWIGSYTPALFRAHPFRFAKADGNDKLTLVIDEENGLSSGGEPFFDDAGQPAPKLAQFIEFLTKLEKSRRKTDQLVQQLSEYDLIEEWPVDVQGVDGQKQRINGLYRISEEALNNLNDEAFLQLRRAQAIPVAYMQLLSMRNVDNLSKLAKAQIEIAQKQASQVGKHSNVLGLTEDSGSLDIDWSQFESKS